MKYAKFYCQLQSGLENISNIPLVSTCQPKHKKKPPGGDRLQL